MAPPPARCFFLCLREYRGKSTHLLRAKSQGHGAQVRSFAGGNKGKMYTLAVELAEVLQLIQGEVVAGEVQHGVLQSAAVAVGQHEAVAVVLKKTGVGAEF